MSPILGLALCASTVHAFAPSFMGQGLNTGLEDAVALMRQYRSRGRAGHEAVLERFVRREPLRRVHECVFGVLALESESVDPRL